MLLKPAGFMRAQTGSSFTETAVNIPSGFYIDSDTSLGAATYTSSLFFASVTPDSGEEGSRRMLYSFKDQSGNLYVNYNVNSAYGADTDIDSDTAANITQNSEAVGLGDRYHILWSTWHDGSDLFSICYIYDTSAGSWSSAWNTSIADATGTYLDLGSSPVRLFNRNAATNHPYIGVIYRAVWWVDASAAAIGDITQASVRNEFINGSSIANPATTQTTYSGATRICDFYGPASNYNTPSGHPDGDGGGDAGHTFSTTGGPAT